MQNKNHKHSSIDILRAIAVILVFLHHLHSIAGITVPYFAHVGGWLGVQIFFVISGYLIIKSANRYPGAIYAKHRIRRIYPAYVFWFIAFSIAFNDLSFESLNLKSLLIHLAFLQHFSPADYKLYNALHVSWTLTIEAAWYAVAFFIAAKFQEFPVKITLISITIACIWIFGANTYYPTYSLLSAEERFFFSTNNAIAQMPFFFLGALIAVTNPTLEKTGLFCIFLVTIILFPAWQMHFPHPIFITGLGVAALLLILENINYNTPKSIKTISDISYSIYLTHYPIIVILNKHINNKYLLAISALSITTAISYLSYKLIEQPFLKPNKRDNLSTKQSSTTPDVSQN